MKYPITALRLREAMEKKNLSAQELADKSGVGKSSISHYVNGNNEPKSINAAKLAEVLEVSPMWLMGFDEKVIEINKKRAVAEKIVPLMLELTMEQLTMVSNLIATFISTNRRTESIMNELEEMDDESYKEL